MELKYFKEGGERQTYIWGAKYTMLIFYKNKFIRTRASFFCSKFKNKLKTIPASTEEQNFKYLQLKW